MGLRFAALRAAGAPLLKQSYDSHCFYTHTILRTNSPKNLVEENIRDFKSRLRVQGYPDLLVNNVLAEVQFTDRKSALRQ